LRIEGFSDGFIFTTRGFYFEVTPGISTNFEADDESPTIALIRRAGSQ
jgi:hypothetical protein